MCNITYRGAGVSTPEGRTPVSYDTMFHVHKELLSQILNTVLRVKERDSKQVGDPFIAPYLAGVYQRLGLEYSGLLCFPRITLLWRRLAAAKHAAAAAAAAQRAAASAASAAAAAAAAAAASAAQHHAPASAATDGGAESEPEPEPAAVPPPHAYSLSYSRPSARVVPLGWHVQQLHRELVLEPWKPADLRTMLSRAAAYAEALGASSAAAASAAATAPGAARTHEPLPTYDDTAGGAARAAAGGPTEPQPGMPAGASHDPGICRALSSSPSSSAAAPSSCASALAAEPAAAGMEAATQQAPLAAHSVTPPQRVTRSDLGDLPQHGHPHFRSRHSHQAHLFPQPSDPWFPSGLNHAGLLLRPAGGGGLGSAFSAHRLLAGGVAGMGAGGGGGGVTAGGGVAGVGGGGVFGLVAFWAMWLCCPTLLVALEAMQTAADNPWLALYIAILAACRTGAEWRTVAGLALAPGLPPLRRLYGVVAAHGASAASAALVTGLLNTWLPLLGTGAAAAVVWLHILLLPAVMVAVMSVAGPPLRTALQPASVPPGATRSSGSRGDPHYTARRGGNGNGNGNAYGGRERRLPALSTAAAEALALARGGDGGGDHRTASPGGGGHAGHGSGRGVSSASAASTAAEVAAAQVHWPPALDVPAWLDDWPNAPEAFRCPITQTIMREPAQASSGVTYERPAILQWLDHRRVDPVTHVPLKRHRLAPNLNLRHMIEVWVQDRVDARRRLAQRLRDEISAETAAALAAGAAAPTAADTAAAADPLEAAPGEAEPGSPGEAETGTGGAAASDSGCAAPADGAAVADAEAEAAERGDAAGGCGEGHAVGGGGDRAAGVERRPLPCGRGAGDGTAPAGRRDGGGASGGAALGADGPPKPGDRPSESIATAALDEESAGSSPAAAAALGRLPVNEVEALAAAAARARAGSRRRQVGCAPAAAPPPPPPSLPPPPPPLLQLSLRPGAGGGGRSSSLGGGGCAGGGSDAGGTAAAARANCARAGYRLIGGSDGGDGSGVAPARYGAGRAPQVDSSGPEQLQEGRAPLRFRSGAAGPARHGPAVVPSAVPAAPAAVPSRAADSGGDEDEFDDDDDGDSDGGSDATDPGVVSSASSQEAEPPRGAAGRAGGGGGGGTVSASGMLEPPAAEVAASAAQEAEAAEAVNGDWDGTGDGDSSGAMATDGGDSYRDLRLTANRRNRDRNARRTAEPDARWMGASGGGGGGSRSSSGDGASGGGSGGEAGGGAGLDADVPLRRGSWLAA